MNAHVKDALWRSSAISLNRVVYDEQELARLTVELVVEMVSRSKVKRHRGEKQHVGGMSLEP